MDPTTVTRASRAFTPTTTGAPPAEPKLVSDDGRLNFDALEPATPPEVKAPDTKAPTTPKAPEAAPLVTDDGRLNFDALGTPPATVAQQASYGVSATRPLPDLGADEVPLYEATREYAKLTNRGPEADDIAYSTVDSIRRQKASGDKSALVSPFMVQGATEAVMARTKEGGLANRAASAFGPQWYGEAAQNRKAAYWRLAETDNDRQSARAVYQGLLEQQGTPREQAKVRAQARYETNAPLLLPTVDNPDFGAAQVDQSAGQTTTSLRNSAKQAAADVVSGGLEVGRDILNAAENLVPTPGGASAVVSGLFGTPEVEALKNQRTFNVGSPTDKLASALEWTGNDTAKSAARRLRDARARNAGILAGVAEATNAAPEWARVGTVDPNADGFVNALWRLALSNPPEGSQPSSTGADVVVETGKTLAAAPGRILDTGKAVREGNLSPLEGAAKTGAILTSTVINPVTETFGLAAHTPEQRESSLGWFMRVPSTTLSAFATTWLARAADYSAVQMGATSARRNRVPGNPEMTAWEAYAPVFMTGSGLHDYITSVANGDSLTPEAMRFADTLLTLPQLSDAAKVSLAPGGATREAMISAGMAGDLLLHLDEAPMSALHLAGDTAGFMSGYRAKRAIGLPAMDAAAIAGASHFPSVTHRLMMNNPEYAKVWGEIEAKDAADLAEYQPGDAKPIPTPVDEDAVRYAAALAHYRREIAAGRNPVHINDHDPRERKNIANTVREMATTAKILPDVERAESTQPQTYQPQPTETPPPLNPDTAYAADVRADGLVDVPPLAVWPDEVQKESDPVRRAGLALASVMERAGFDPGTGHGAAKVALRAALSYYDPKTGMYVRAPDITDAYLRSLDPVHLTAALDTLKNASPEQVLRNTANFQGGSVVRWTDERVPDRQRVRDELHAAAAAGKANLRPEDIESFLTVQDHIAQKLVERGVIPSVDAWYARHAYEPRGGVGGADVLRQDRPDHPFTAIARADVERVQAALREQNPQEGEARAAQVAKKVNPTLQEIAAEAARVDAEAEALRDAPMDATDRAVSEAKYTASLDRLRDLRKRLNVELENESRKAKATPPPVSTRTGTDAVRARLSAGERFDGIRPEDARDAQRMLEMLGHPLEGAQFKLREKVGTKGTALGAYDFANDVLAIAHKAFDQGESARTLAHEIGHRVSMWLPKDKAAALMRQYIKERRAAIRENPTWFDQNGHLTDAGKKAPEAYRWTDQDEWFAERFADHAKKRLVQWDAATRSVMDAARFMLEKVRARVVDFFGIDRVPAIVEDLMAGNLEPVVQDAQRPLRQRLITVQPTMDVRKAPDVLRQDREPAPHVTDKTGIDTGAFGGATHAHQAVAWIAGNSKDPQMAAMARRILPLVPKDVPISIIQSGTTYTFGPGREDVPRHIHGAMGVFTYDERDPSYAGHIWLRGSSFEDGTAGVTDSTMLHEAIHAAVDQRIREGNLVKTPDGPAKAGAKMFYDLNNDLVRWYNAQQKAGTLPAFAKSDRFLNAMNSPRELATYGLTDKLVQDAFRQIKLPGESKSLWTRFVSSLRGILGLAPSDDSALARVADATNTILSDVLGDQGLLEERPHGERLPMTVEEMAREEKRGKLSYEIDNKSAFFSALREKVKVREYASQKALTNSVLAGEPLTVEAIRAAGGTATEADIAALQPAVDKLRAAFEPVAPRWTEDLHFGEEVPDDVRTRDILTQDTPATPKGEIDFTDFVTTGRALIRLAADADLSTLYHESAHLLRRILPVEHMRNVDAFVQERFGGWTNVEAEEWFARQHEAVLRTGKLKVPKADKVIARWAKKLTDALRWASDTLASIYKDGTLPKVDPVYAAWMRDFLALELPTEAVTPDPAVTPPRKVRPGIARSAGEPSIPVVSREGWSPALVADLEQSAAEIRKMPAGSARKNAVSDWLSKAHATLGEDKATRQKRHIIARYNPDLVMDTLLNVGRDVVKGMSPEERAKADAGYLAVVPPVAETVGAEAPAAEVPPVEETPATETPVADVGSEPNDAPSPGAPETPAPAPVPASPPKDTSKTATALEKAVDALAERLRNRVSPGDVTRAAASVIARTAEHLAATRGEPKPEKPNAYLGDAAIRFLDQVKKATKDLTDTKLGVKDGGDIRDRAAREAVAELVGRTMPREERAPEPVVRTPTSLPPELDIIPAATPSNGPPETVKMYTERALPSQGASDIDETGMQRVMVDSQGIVYPFRIIKMRLADLFTSHTPGLAWREGYDRAFQNRIDAWSRVGWIDDTARAFNPQLGAHPTGITPTVGAVTIWRDPEGRAVVVAGNGRSLAMMRLFEMGSPGTDANYAGLLASLQGRTQSWCAALGMDQPLADEIMVRELTAASYEEAVRFAQNSQDVPSQQMAATAEILKYSVLVRNAGFSKLDVESVPSSWDHTTVIAFVKSSPDLTDAITKAGVDLEDPNLKPDDLLSAVRGAFLAIIPQDVVDASTAGGDRLINALAVAGPAIAKLSTLAADRPSIAAADPVGAIRDGLVLYTKSRTGGKRGEALGSTKGLANFALDQSRQYTLIRGAKAVPVSALSFAVTDAIRRLVAPVSATTSGLGSMLLSVAKDVEASLQGSMFAPAANPAETLLNGVIGGSKEVAEAVKQFPASHTEAVEYARNLEMAGIEQSLPDPITDPPGFDVIKVLAQHREYTATLSPPVKKGSPGAPVPDIQVRSEDIGRDQPPTFKAAQSTQEGATTPYGVATARRRSIPLLTHEQVNLALGYRADQRTYNARDFAARAAAWAHTYPDQATAPRSRYQVIGNRIAVPVRRVAAVRGRTLAILGDIPTRIAEVVKNRPPAAPGVDPARMPIGLGATEAGRIKTILNVLDANGWSESLPRSLRGLSVQDIMGKMSVQDFNEVVGAVMDSQSGAVPFRGRTSQYAMARQLVYTLAQKPGGLFSREPLEKGASDTAVAVNNLRERVGAAIQSIAYYILPTDEAQPDMRPDLRPIWQQHRRAQGQVTSQFAEALTSYLEAYAKPSAPGSMTHAVDQIARTLPGATPHISTRRGVNGGPSDLHRLRAWLFDGPPPDPNAPVVPPHDLPRTRPLVDPVGECIAMEDVLTRVLAPPNRRVTPDNVDLLHRLRNRTLSPDDAALLIGKSWAAIGAAEQLGREFLASAAGHTGDPGRLDKVLPSFSGMPLDAYEAFYEGRWSTSPNAGDTANSIEDMIQRLGVSPRAVPTPLWVSETFMRQNLRAEMGKLTDDLMDREFVFGLSDIAKAGGVDPTDVVTSAAFAEEVRNAVNHEMWGTNYISTAGVDLLGRTFPGIPNYGNVSERALATARIIIAKMGLRPDVIAIRKGVKGEIAPNRTVARFVGLPTDPVERMKKLIDPSYWRDVAGADPAMNGNDFYIYDVAAQHLASTLERHTPLAERLAATISMRGAPEILRRVGDVYRQLKGSFITGGPNGWLALAVAGGSLAGGATVAGAAALGTTAWALSFTPRFAGYVNNAVGAIMQGVIELGWRDTARAFNPLSAEARAGQELAFRASMDTVRYHRMGKAVDAVGRILNNLVSGNRKLEQVVIVARDGRVHTGADVRDIALRYGLDGTQARFESAENVARTMDRLYATYESSPTFTAGMFRQLDAFFGRYKLTENYRRLYEQVDTYFRYVWLVRGLQEGLNPDDAVNRALRISFDYTSTSALDRQINSVFMFWMYQRRALDLTISALIDHPHTVLGMLRFARAQNLASGYADLNSDYERLSETESDTAMARPAFTYLPAAGGHTAAQKILLTEPPQVTAIRLMQDASSLDPAGAMSRANPMWTVGYNIVSRAVGGPYVSFFSRRTAEGPGDWRVPMRLVLLDQSLAGGAITRLMGIAPRYVMDAQDRATGVQQDFYVTNSRRWLWDIYKNLVPDFSTFLSDQETQDRAGTIVDDLTLEGLYWLAAADPGNKMGLREVPQPGGTMSPAVDLHARPALGEAAEAGRLIGFSPSPVLTPFAARAQPAYAASKAMQAVTQEEQDATKITRPPTPPAGDIKGPDTIKGAKGLDPNKPRGLEGRPK